MTDHSDAPTERRELVYRHHERLYRLALLVAGDDIAAADLVEQAYRRLAIAAPDAETALIRALLAGRSRRRWRWRADAASLTRSGLGEAQANALLAQLAKMTPLARLVVGLHYLVGSAPDEIAARLGPALGEQPPADLLARFRIDAARALGRVPPDANAEEVARLDRWMEGQLSEDETLALRRELFERADLRDLRDGLSATRELLPRAIPALFAAMPPLSLTNRLLQVVQGRRQPRVPRLPARRAQILLATGVLVLAAAIVFGPGLLSRPFASEIRRASTAPELIEAAIHRFSAAPLKSGVLREQYRVDWPGQTPYLIERLYDYATPNRLAVTVRGEGENARPLMQISSDGRSVVQFRLSREAAGERYAADARVSEDEARVVMPLLRGQPTGSVFRRGPQEPGDPGPLYLAQARASSPTMLGQSTLLGREVFLLTYRAAAPPTLDGQPSGGQPIQVVLSIDAQTAALLDIAVLPDGAAEGAARHPLQALQFEIQSSVPDDRFYLPSAPDVAQQNGIASVRFPYIPGEQLLTLEDAARQSAEPLLAPQDLPDQQMRGLAVAVNRDTRAEVALVYEGEFQDVLVLPYARPGSAADAGEERSAGEFRYRLLTNSGFQNGLAAVVYQPAAPERSLMMVLSNEYATEAERETQLHAMIASLTPVDSRTLPVLRRNFQTPRATAGGS